MAPQVAILVIDNQKGPIDINVKTDKCSWVHSLKAKTDEAGFDLVTEETKVSLLTTNTIGLHYIAVPAGVQLCIKDGDTEIKSTTTAGFKAGKYYELTLANTVTFDANGHGTAPSALSEVPYGSTIDNPTAPTSPAATFEGWFKDKACTESWNFASDIVVANTTLYAKWTYTARGTSLPTNWVQLWENGPRFAEYNVYDRRSSSNDPYEGHYLWGMHENNHWVYGGSCKADRDFKGGPDPLSGDYDTATYFWGDNWRMPTKGEYEALIKNCDIAWTTVNDVSGVTFTGKGEYWESSVFFPAAGYTDTGTYAKLFYDNVFGRYWTATPTPKTSYDYYDNRAYIFYISSDNGGAASVDPGERLLGYSVRAVLAK